MQCVRPKFKRRTVWTKLIWALAIGENKELQTYFQTGLFWPLRARMLLEKVRLSVHCQQMLEVGVANQESYFHQNREARSRVVWLLWFCFRLLYHYSNASAGVQSCVTTSVRNDNQTASEVELHGFLCRPHPTNNCLMHWIRYTTIMQLEKESLLSHHWLEVPSCCWTLTWDDHFVNVSLESVLWLWFSQQ